MEERRDVRQALYLTWSRRTQVEGIKLLLVTHGNGANDGEGQSTGELAHGGVLHSPDEEWSTG